MGTPEFSIPSLKLLKESNHKIISVYTQPPKKKSRGQKLLKTAIHIYSEKEGLAVRTNRLSEKAEYEEFIKLKPDLVVVIAYGQIIPETFLKIPNLIFLNVHASLLPKYRGAAPIERAVLNKEIVTGVTIMKIEKKLDSGPFMKQVKVKIEKDTSSGDLTKILSNIGAEAIKEAIDQISNGKAVFKKQNEQEATYAKKIDKTETKINWNDKAENIVAKINAFNPKPGAWFIYKNERIKILKAKEIEVQGKAGIVLDSQLTVGCFKNAIQILRVQKEGKRDMDVLEFLSGNKINKGSKLN